MTNPETPKQGVVKRAITNVSDSFQERKKQAEKAMNDSFQKTILSTLLPKVKELIPGVEKKLKNFLGGTANEDFPGDGIEKLVLMRLNPKTNEVEIRILNASLVDIMTKAGMTKEEAGAAVLKAIRLDEYVESFISGKFDSFSDALTDDVK